MRQELQQHLQQLVDDLMAEGTSRQQAELIAARKFGDIDSIERRCNREIARTGHRFAWLGLSLRLALRSLAKSPGYAVSVGLLLASGVAVALSAASFIKAYLLDPLPYPGSERLFRVLRAEPGTLGMPGAPAVPQGLNSIDWPRSDSVIEQNVAWEFDDFSLMGFEFAERIYGIWTTPGYFEAYGVSPMLGRAFDQSDVESGNPVVVLGYELWRRRYGADSAIVGTTVTLHATDREEQPTSFTVIGVMPGEFESLNGQADVVLPLWGTRRPSLILARPGVTASALASHLTAHARARLPTESGWRMYVVPARESHVAPVRGTLWMLAAAALLVVVVVLGNSTILILARSVARSRESAIRRALGARTLQEYGTQMAEAGLPVLAGAVLGIAGAALLLAIISSSVAGYLGVSIPGAGGAIGLDGGIAAWGMVLSLAITLALGAVPWVVDRAGGSHARLSGRGGLDEESPRKGLLRSALMALQVAGSLALVAAAIQMWHATRLMQQRDLGFDSQGVTLAYLSLRQVDYPDPGRISLFYGSLMESVAELPGISSAGLIDAYPFQVTRGSQIRTSEVDSDRGYRVIRQLATPGYFQVMQLPFVAGRSFAAGSQAEVVISQSLADLLWPGQDPLGRRLRIGNWQGIPESEGWRVVTGVVPDAAKSLVGEDWPDVYLPFEADPRGDMYLLVRSDLPWRTVVEQLQLAVAHLDPRLPLAELRQMTDVVADNLVRPRFLSSVLSASSMLAVSLTVAGLLAVLSYLVRRSRREIALRIAVGAGPAAVLAWVSRRAALPLGAGIILGLPAGTWLTQQISALYPSTGVPVTLTALILMAAASCLALALPAWRASRIDPASVLKSE